MVPASCDAANPRRAGGNSTAPSSVSTSSTTPPGGGFDLEPDGPLRLRRELQHGRGEERGEFVPAAGDHPVAGEDVPARISTRPPDSRPTTTGFLRYSDDPAALASSTRTNRSAPSRRTAAGRHCRAGLAVRDDDERLPGHARLEPRLGPRRVREFGPHGGHVRARVEVEALRLHRRAEHLAGVGDEVQLDRLADRHPVEVLLQHPDPDPHGREVDHLGQVFARARSPFRP